MYLDVLPVLLEQRGQEVGGELHVELDLVLGLLHVSHGHREAHDLRSTTEDKKDEQFRETRDRTQVSWPCRSHDYSYGPAPTPCNRLNCDKRCIIREKNNWTPALCQPTLSAVTGRDRRQREALGTPSKALSTLKIAFRGETKTKRTLHPSTKEQPYICNQPPRIAHALISHCTKSTAGRTNSKHARAANRGHTLTFFIWNLIVARTVSTLL